MSECSQSKDPDWKDGWRNHLASLVKFACVTLPVMTVPNYQIPDLMTCTLVNGKSTVAVAKMTFHARMFLRKMFSTLNHGPNIIGSHHLKKIKAQSDIKKAIIVALVGFANAGKSTLINAMLGLKICAASKRPLTTVECQRVFYVKDDTKITLLDTPGILSSRLKARSDFADSEYVIKTRSVQKAHVVGVIVDASCRFVRYDVKSHMKFLCNMFSPDTEFVLILNKVDKVKTKSELLNIAEKFYAAQFPLNNTNLQKKDDTRKFSQIFMISALKNDGVNYIIEYLRSVAPPFSGSSPDSISDHPDAKVVEHVIRAALLECIPKEIPYKCTCELEFMEENSFGHLQIVVLIKCPSIRCYNGVRRDPVLNNVERKSVNDLEALFGVKVSIRLLPILKPKDD